jgi:AcrR family transcriptional regulator
MGISQRKEREKEDLKKSILDAARTLFLEKGYEQTSIRNIAEKIEYSPTTIYLYFEDKDAIFHEIHDQAFLLLQSEFAQLRNIEDPLERLEMMGKMYIDFALKNKELYDLMFILEAPMNALKRKDECWDEGADTFQGLKSLVRECMDKGLLMEQDVEEVSFFIWSTVHGMCSLFIRNRCVHVIENESLNTIVEKSYSAMFKILEIFKNKK